MDPKGIIVMILVIFGMPQTFQKCMKLAKYPNFRKQIVKPSEKSFEQVD